MTQGTTSIAGGQGAATSNTGSGNMVPGDQGPDVEVAYADALMMMASKVLR